MNLPGPLENRKVTIWKEKEKQIRCKLTLKRQIQDDKNNQHKDLQPDNRRHRVKQFGVSFWFHFSDATVYFPIASVVPVPDQNQLKNQSWLGVRSCVSSVCDYTTLPPAAVSPGQVMQLQHAEGQGDGRDRQHEHDEHVLLCRSGHVTVHRVRTGLRLREREKRGRGRREGEEEERGRREREGEERGRREGEEEEREREKRERRRREGEEEEREREKRERGRREGEEEERERKKRERGRREGEREEEWVEAWICFYHRIESNWFWFLFLPCRHTENGGRFHTRSTGDTETPPERRRSHSEFWFHVLREVQIHIYSFFIGNFTLKCYYQRVSQKED